MVRAVALWMRRSSATIAFPAMVALVLVAAWSRTGWQYEWDWALSWTASATILLGPMVAGLVAHDRARRHAPTLVLVERTTSRGTLAALSAPIAGFTLAMTAWIAAALVVLARVWNHGAVGRPGLTMLLEVALVLLASAFLGAATGSWVTNRAAGPIAAISVYALFVSGPHLTLGGLMNAGGSLDTLVDLRRNPEWLAGFVGVHLAMALAAAMVILARRTVLRSAQAAVLAGAIVVLVAGALAFKAGKADGPYQEIAVETHCLGQAPELCGPSKSAPVLEIAEEGLRRAYADLADSGLTLRERYVMARGLPGNTFPDDAGDLSVDPSLFVDGAYSRDDVVMTIATPTLCERFFLDEPPRDLMNAQSTVMQWLDQRLSGKVDGEAPADVVDGYRRLLKCRPHRGDL